MEEASSDQEMQNGRGEDDSSVFGQYYKIGKRRGNDHRNGSEGKDRNTKCDYHHGAPFDKLSIGEAVSLGTIISSDMINQECITLS